MKILLLILLLLLLGSMAVKLKVSAPELFGTSVGYGFQTTRFEIIILPVHWQTQDFLFLMTGHLQGNRFKGFVVQLLGKKIESYGPYTCSTLTVFCYERTLQKNWSGWLEFR